MSMKGKAALVTGGAMGIGLECVKALLQNGAQNVAVCDVDALKGEKAVRELQTEYGADRVIFIKTDVANVAELEGAFKQTYTTFNALDIVINNAGILDDRRWEREIATNVNAVVRGTLLGLQYMGKENGGKGGAVVNIASIAGLAPFAGCPVYSATKHAIVGLSRSFGVALVNATRGGDLTEGPFALELPYHYDRTGVRVMVTCPSVTDTTIFSEANTRVLREEWFEEIERSLQEIPMQKPESVAKGMIHLIEKGTSGSVWVVEDGKPVYEILIPDWHTLRVE